MVTESKLAREKPRMAWQSLQPAVAEGRFNPPGSILKQFKPDGLKASEVGTFFRLVEWELSGEDKVIDGLRVSKQNQSDIIIMQCEDSESSENQFWVLELSLMKSAPETDEYIPVGGGLARLNKDRLGRIDPITPLLDYHEYCQVLSDNIQAERPLEITLGFLGADRARRVITPLTIKCWRRYQKNIN